jgi:hypothetical protein
MAWDLTGQAGRRRPRVIIVARTMRTRSARGTFVPSASNWRARVAVAEGFPKTSLDARPDQPAGHRVVRPRRARVGCLQDGFHVRLSGASGAQGGWGVMAEQTMDCGRPWWRMQSILFNERRLGSLCA